MLVSRADYQKATPVTRSPLMLLGPEFSPDPLLPFLEIGGHHMTFDDVS